MANMEVILLERVESLGNMGETVRVKPGYARNFLLPQKKPCAQPTKTRPSTTRSAPSWKSKTPQNAVRPKNWRRS